MSPVTSCKIFDNTQFNLNGGAISYQHIDFTKNALNERLQKNDVKAHVCVNKLNLTPLVHSCETEEEKISFIKRLGSWGMFFHTNLFVRNVDKVVFRTLQCIEFIGVKPRPFFGSRDAIFIDAFESAFRKFINIA